MSATTGNVPMSAFRSLRCGVAVSPRMWPSGFCSRNASMIRWYEAAATWCASSTTSRSRLLGIVARFRSLTRVWTMPNVAFTPQFLRSAVNKSLLRRGLIAVNVFRFWLTSSSRCWRISVRLYREAAAESMTVLPAPVGATPSAAPYSSSAAWHFSTNAFCRGRRIIKKSATSDSQGQ